MSKKTENTLVLLDPKGEVLLECELGDKYHKLILEVGLNKILKDTIKHMKSERKIAIDGIYKSVLENGGEGSLSIKIPKEFVNSLGWKEAQDMEIEYVESYTDEGQFHALCVTNVSLGKING